VRINVNERCSIDVEEQESLESLVDLVELIREISFGKFVN
jgi:hypothetical protein